MDPTARSLLQVRIEDTIEADKVFTMLMGDEVEPRPPLHRAKCTSRGQH